MKRYVGAVVFVVFMAWASVLQAADWAGIYRMEGKNPDGTTYSGAVEIQAVPETALFQITWMLDGHDGVMLVVFGFEFDGQLHGSGVEGPMAFALKADGDARWAIPTAAFTSLGVEKLTRVKVLKLKDALRSAGGKV